MEQMIKTQSGDTTESQAWTSPSVSDRGSITVPNNARDLPGLIHFNRARRELELASSVDEVKQIRDKAEAMRIYARQATHSLEMQNMCAEIKLRAERRLGEMLSETGVSKSKSKSKSKNNNLLRGRSVQLRDNTPSLAELGISKSQSSRWQLIIMSKPPALPGDSQSLTFPGVFVFWISGGRETQKTNGGRVPRPKRHAMKRPGATLKGLPRPVNKGRYEEKLGKEHGRSNQACLTSTALSGPRIQASGFAGGH